MSASDREDIVQSLRGLLWRTRLNHAVKTLVAGAGVLLLTWLVLEGAGATSSTRGWVMAIGVAGVSGCLAWQLIRSERLSRMAGMADGRCDLKDELKTAYRFIADHEDDKSVDRFRRARIRLLAIAIAQPLEEARYSRLDIQGLGGPVMRHCHNLVAGDPGVARVEHCRHGVKTRLAKIVAGPNGIGALGKHGDVLARDG